MFKRPLRFIHRTRRWFVCCCLFIALPICCVSTLLAALLGPVHFHESAAVAGVGAAGMAGWQDFRRMNHVADSVVRVHDHTMLGRHRHDSNDPGFVVVGAGDHEDSAESATPGVAVVLVLAAPQQVSVGLPTPLAAPRGWRASRRCDFESCAVRRLDRPPIA